MPIDAERIGKRQGHLPPGLGGDTCRLPEGGLGLGPVEQIALQIDDARRGDEFRIDLAATELRADAQERVHGALAVRRHQDEGAGCRLAALGGGRRREGHAGGANVVAEHAAELVVGGLADEARLAAERGDADMVLATEPPEISTAGPMAS